MEHILAYIKGEGGVTRSCVIAHEFRMPYSRATAMLDSLVADGELYVNEYGDYVTRTTIDTGTVSCPDTQRRMMMTTTGGVTCVNTVALDAITDAVAGGSAYSTSSLISRVRPLGFTHGEAMTQVALAYRDGVIRPSSWGVSEYYELSYVTRWVAS